MHSQNISYHSEALSAQNRIPFPVVMAGIGLILAWAFPGGLTGGQGFLIGFTLGILAPGIVSLYLATQRTRQIKLAREIETAISKLQSNEASEVALRRIEQAVRKLNNAAWRR
ncbi:MAG: hypothetical protein ACREEM_33560 [Blastocatellia bacterium]